MIMRHAAPHFSFFFFLKLDETPEGRTLKTNGAESSVLVVLDRELMAWRASGWSGASTCGQLVAGQLFIPLPFSLSSSSLMRSRCFRLAELRVVPIVSDLAPSADCSARSRWASCSQPACLIRPDRYGAALSTPAPRSLSSFVVVILPLPTYEIDLSPFPSDSPPSPLLPHTPSASRSNEKVTFFFLFRARVFFASFSPFGTKPRGPSGFFFVFFFSRGLIRGEAAPPRALASSPAEQNVTPGFSGTAATNSCGPPGGQRCRCCSHKVTLMSRNREKHMCPDLEAPFHFSTSFACAAANNEPEAVRGGWGGLRWWWVEVKLLLLQSAAH